MPATLVGELDPAQPVGSVPSLRRRARAAVSELLDLAGTYYVSGEQGLWLVGIQMPASIAAT